MEQTKYTLKFDNLEASEANVYARELEQMLLDTGERVDVKIAKQDNDTQDFGATLIIGILGTPAIIALANKIGDWLVLRRKAAITIEAPDGKLVVENLTGKNAAELADKWIEKANQKSNA